VSHSAERAMQQQQHFVQRTAKAIQPVAATIRASKPSPLTISFAATTASISAGQPSPQTAYIRAPKPFAPPTSAARTRA